MGIRTNKAIGNSKAEDYSFEIDSSSKANQNIKSDNSSQDNHQSSDKDFNAGLYGGNPFSEDQIQLSDDLFIHTDPLAWLLHNWLIFAKKMQISKTLTN